LICAVVGAAIALGGASTANASTQPPLLVPAVQQVRDRLAAIDPTNPTIQRVIGLLNVLGSQTCANALATGGCFYELQQLLLDPGYVVVNGRTVLLISFAELYSIVALSQPGADAVYAKALTNPACTTPAPGQTASSTPCWKAGYFISMGDAAFARAPTEGTVGSLQHAVYGWANGVAYAIAYAT
jgi:hypothetical protein